MSDSPVVRGDPAFAREYARLAAHVYADRSPPEEWDAAALLRAAGRARKQLAGSARGESGNELAVLNP